MPTEDAKLTRSTVESSYDALAREYASHISDELNHRPMERDLLRQLAQAVRNTGPICDVGCGPGHVAAYITQFGADVFGLDLSFELLMEARRASPEIVFAQGDMLELPIASGSLGGIVAFYSIIHFDDEQLARAFSEMRRALVPGGRLLLGFHVGTETVHPGELWGIKVDFNARFFMIEDLVSRLAEAGFTVVGTFRRNPHPEVEYQSVRGYILASA